MVPPMTSTITGERADLLETLAKHRFFPRNTARDLTDEQAAARTTVSALCVGGLIEAPWFEPGATWSARRVFLHIVAETAQHAGHADIIREAVDGAKSMG